jgi:hypothetical protein
VLSSPSGAVLCCLVLSTSCQQRAASPPACLIGGGGGWILGVQVLSECFAAVTVLFVITTGRKPSHCEAKSKPPSSCKKIDINDLCHNYSKESPLVIVNKLSTNRRYSTDQPSLNNHVQSIQNPLNKGRIWRRGWDSNPRWTRAHNGFRDRLLRPLGHLSVDYLNRLWSWCEEGAARHVNRVM